MIGNLLSNAIKHTEGDGPIRITIDHDRLEISNPGDAELEDAERIFRRFYRKNERSKPGSGLGLAIVQKICEVLQYNVTYHFAENRHFSGSFLIKKVLIANFKRTLEFSSSFPIQMF